MHQHYTTSHRGLPFPHVPRVPIDRVTLSSRIKTSIVVALGFLLAWKPKLAAYLGKLIWRLLPRLRGA